MATLTKDIRDKILLIYNDLESEEQLRDTSYEDFVKLFQKYLSLPTQEPKDAYTLEWWAKKWIKPISGTKVVMAAQEPIDWVYVWWYINHEATIQLIIDRLNSLDTNK